jgi:DsbC/DsbD-like thiol-disulfide interchange protein
MAFVALLFCLVLTGTASAQFEPGAQEGGAKRSDNVVHVSAIATRPDASGRRTATFRLAIEPGWHLYANPVAKEDFPGIPTTVTLEGRPQPADVKVHYPPGKLVKDPVAGDHFIYEGAVTIEAQFRRPAGAGSLEATIKLQACNEHKCLLPATVKVPVR